MPVEAGVAKVSVPLPAVISCDKGDFKPRKANVKGIMMAKKAQVELMTAGAPASTVVVASHSMPAAKPAVRPSKVDQALRKLFNCFVMKPTYYEVKR